MASISFCWVGFCMFGFRFRCLFTVAFTCWICGFAGGVLVW